MNTTDTDRLDTRLNRLGASLFFHPTTVAHAAAAGIDNLFVMYAGRGGVMGDITADQIASAFCFFDEQVVNDVWQGMRSYGTPSQIGAVFAEAMALAASEVWDADAAIEVTRLGLQVIESVTPMGMALFAGWRRIARDSAEVSRVVHALRELRGDIHIQSIAAAGLHPLHAEMVTRGEPGARLHGYKPPYPDPAPFVERVAIASAATSERMQAIYTAALTTTDLAQFDAAVAALAGPALP